MSNFFREKILPKSISKKEASDTGMAMALICLLLGLWSKRIIFYEITIPVLIVNMTFPMFYYPFAMVWLGLTNLLGIVVSRVLLSVVYILFLMPVGIIRRSMGRDSLNLRGFKKSKESVMITRNIEFKADDIKNPF